MQHIIYWISHPTEFKLFLAIVEQYRNKRETMLI